MRYERYIQYTSKWTVIKMIPTREHINWCHKFESEGAFSVAQNFTELKFQLLTDAVTFKLSHQLSDSGFELKLK